MPHSSLPADPHKLAETIGERLKAAADHSRGDVERVLHRTAGTLRRLDRRRFKRIRHDAHALARRVGSDARTRPALLGVAAAGLAALAGVVLLSRRRARP